MKSLSIQRSTIIIIVLACLGFAGLVFANTRNTACCEADGACCTPEKPKAAMNTSTSHLVCKLSSKELEERKTTVLAELKTNIIERKELPNGYSFKFKGDDESIDRLVSFIKSERACCAFFTYGLSVTEDYAQLDLTGPEGAKDFVTEEMGL